jgi:hypothetical protein
VLGSGPNNSKVTLLAYCFRVSDIVNDKGRYVAQKLGRLIHDFCCFGESELNLQ